ncbi:FecR domain-containing protein [bacterium]|nr:FecR domain-containing protein [bacterium]
MRNTVFGYLCGALLSLIVPTVVLADSKEQIEVYALSGEAHYQERSGDSWTPLQKEQRLPFLGTVKVSANSRVGLRFPDGKLVRLRENSELTLQSPKNQKKKELSLVQGALHLFNRLGKAQYTVKTPEVSAAIRGTELVISSENGSSQVTVFDGEVLLDAQQKTLRLQQGESGLVKKDRAPQKTVLAHPSGQVEWALYFPSLFMEKDYRAAKKNSLPLFKVYELAFRARYSTALEKLRSEIAASDEKLLLESSLLLLTGSTSEAREILGKVQSPLLQQEVEARRAIIELITNQRDRATQRYRALDLNEKTPHAFLLGALLNNRMGDFEESLKVIDRALKLFPEEPTFLARRAELLLAQDRTEAALQAAESAHNLRPEDPYTLSILGFISLARRNQEQAGKYFQQALEVNGDIPEASFGRALTLMADGDLQQGREALEQTVHLDSARSLYRSYLGKAYFEEEREDKAEKEYALAIDRDPNDPTPYLYRAFNRLSRNNIVGALNDVEDSIEKNDARAVYRSRSLLDQDLGVRTTSLSEVFRQLGFRDIARIEALKSLSHDYTNYSAHRLLGEVLEGDYFSDAKFSQRIISELLSPLSFNSFQSFNGFSAEPSSGDYAALFDRPEQRAAINITGTNIDDRYEGSVLQSGVSEQVGHLLSYGHRNLGASDLTEHRARMALQYQGSLDHRFIVEGDITQYDDENSGDEKFERRDITGALSSYHRLTPQTEAINRLEYFSRKRNNQGIFFDAATQNLTTEFGVIDFPEFELELDQRTEEDITTLRGNSQLIHRNEQGTLISGFEFIYANGDADENSIIISDDINTFEEQRRNRNSLANYNTQSVSAYTYYTHEVVSWFHATIGANYRRIELPGFDTIAPFVSGEREKNQLSPKAAFTLTPTDSLTVRGAYFKNLGSASIDDIGTLEPTVVGSFVQLLGDLPGASSETAGIGVDYKVPKSLYTGVEYTYRDLERSDLELLSQFDIDAGNLTETVQFTPDTSREEEQERLVRGYLYTVLDENTTTLLEYRRSDLESFDIGEEIETDRVRLGARYFSPRRWFALSELDWYRQDRSGINDMVDGAEEFWILNAGIGYRIPKRHGQVTLQVVNILDEDFSYVSRQRFRDPPRGIGFLADVSINF